MHKYIPTYPDTASSSQSESESVSKSEPDSEHVSHSESESPGDAICHSVRGECLSILDISDDKSLISISGVVGMYTTLFFAVPIVSKFGKRISNKS